MKRRKETWQSSTWKYKASGLRSLGCWTLRGWAMVWDKTMPSFRASCLLVDGIKLHQGSCFALWTGTQGFLSGLRQCEWWLSVGALGLTFLTQKWKNPAIVLFWPQTCETLTSEHSQACQESSDLHNCEKIQGYCLVIYIFVVHR